MKKLIVNLFLVFVTSISYAQYNSIVFSGEVQYEFKVNQYERAKKIVGNQITDDLFRNHIQSLSTNKFFTRQFVLTFNRESSLFKETVKQVPANNFDFVVDFPTQYVYRNLKSDSIYMEKNVVGERIEIKDKSVPITWKYTNERMNILGYECRRANGLFSDSVYVVAFYCPDIPVSGGPSIFGGLPGLIVGISLPHDNINIFAEKIEIKQTSIDPPKTKSIKSIKSYLDFLNQSFSTNDKAIQRLKFNLRTALL